VLVTDFHILAAHDGDSTQRAFSTFSLYGWNSGTSAFDLFYTVDPPLPYGDGMYNGGPSNNLLDRCSVVPALVTDRFRAEFTQEGGGPFGAPRVIELDAFGSVVAPTPVPSIPNAAMTHQPSPNAAVTVGAVLILLRSADSSSAGGAPSQRPRRNFGGVRH